MIQATVKLVWSAVSQSGQYCTLCRSAAAILAAAQVAASLAA